MGYAGSSTNLYLYTRGDPLDYVDPTGRISVNPFQPLEEWGKELAHEVGEFVSPATEVASRAAEGIEEGVNWVDPGKRYEEVNNTIECVAEIGIHLEIDGKCSVEGGKPGEEGPDPPEPPSTPPPGVPGIRLPTPTPAP